MGWKIRRGGYAGVAGYGINQVSSPAPVFRTIRICFPSGENLTEGELKISRVTSVDEYTFGVWPGIVFVQRLMSPSVSRRRCAIAVPSREMEPVPTRAVFGGISAKSWGSPPTGDTDQTAFADPKRILPVVVHSIRLATPLASSVIFVAAGAFR